MAADGHRFEMAVRCEKHAAATECTRWSIDLPRGAMTPNSSSAYGEAAAEAVAPSQLQHAGPPPAGGLSVDTLATGGGQGVPVLSTSGDPAEGYSGSGVELIRRWLGQATGLPL